MATEQQNMQYLILPVNLTRSLLAFVASILCKPVWATQLHWAVRKYKTGRSSEFFGDLPVTVPEYGDHLAVAQGPVVQN